VIAEIADRGTMLTLGSSFNVKPIATQVEDVADVERALASLAAGANGGLIVNSDISRSAIVWPSSQRQLAVPAIYPFAFFTDAGGLAAYGTDIPDLWRRAASYLDRILRGEKPADLPVQAPTKFQLVINLKTAKVLGLDVPPDAHRPRRRGDRMSFARSLVRR
jgi:ABC-type uncharacterized transport system substrate-binding protein